MKWVSIVKTKILRLKS